MTTRPLDPFDDLKNAMDPLRKLRRDLDPLTPVKDILDFDKNIADPFGTEERKQQRRKER